MLAEANAEDRFQFQRLGYFVCDKDSTPTKKVFNKTVGLRDTWEKQQQQPQQAKPKQQQLKPIDELRRLGKKFSNLSAEKQLAASTQVEALATQISYAELEPLFNTAAKKVGTRAVVLLVLKEQLKTSSATPEATAFIAKAQQDKNELLVKLSHDIKA